MTNETSRSLAFDHVDPSLRPTKQSVSSRSAFYLLANIDEHPEVLPMALDIAMEHLGNATVSPDDPDSLPQLVAWLEQQRVDHSQLWSGEDNAASRRLAMHFFRQYAPAAMVDGCWLQCVLRVATAHTPTGAQMSALYEHQVRAYSVDPQQHFVSEYRDLYRRLLTPIEDVSVRAFSESTDFDDFSFDLPLLLMSIGQFPRAFVPELLGVHLAWQFLGLASVGPDLIRNVRSLHSMPTVDGSLADSDHLEQGRQLTLVAAKQLLADESNGSSDDIIKRLRTGAAALAGAWSEWLNCAQKLAPTGPPDPRQEMIEMLCRKAPHAYGYHGNKRLGEDLIDAQFAPEKFNPSALLDNLATSRFVTPGNPEKSYFVNNLVAFGGPMLAVFSETDLKIARDWIRMLPAQEQVASDQTTTAASAQIATHKRPMWSKTEFRRRSETRFARCSVRELYHHLVNVERYPDILPVAERFARNRLARSMARLTGGTRPIPSETYDPDVFEDWVYNKHREQVDSYRPLDGEPTVSREAFVEGTVQLAPLILIDGGWLQNVPNPNIIHTDIGRMLFHIFYEELGAGDPAAHHANIYRDLLAAMGEEAPPVETMEFAQWTRLHDASFDVPTLWLS
ncbi:MAG: iron-containing redox enzyme family protein, partial [Gammaproteobacteria bacterium]|nr:iron-containing redox enzyme family protein [Gammaproteobacteria bacterium]